MRIWPFIPKPWVLLVEVNAKVGQHVSAGQVLAQINDAAYQEQLNTLQTTYALAVETFQKQENLWKQQIGSEIQYLQAKTNKESLESQIASVNKQIDMTRIKSPYQGLWKNPWSRSDRRFLLPCLHSGW